MVCCHVWAGTTTNPLLFSFVPNLVWLPSSLAPYSDAHAAGVPHIVHETLKAISIARYQSVEPLVAKARVDAAWCRLQPGTASPERHEHLEFAIEDQLVKLINGRIDRLEAFLAATLDETRPWPRRFSRRYHAGVEPGIDSTTWPVQRAVSEHARRQLLADLKAIRATSDTGR
jgi:hypothetical protein